MKQFLLHLDETLGKYRLVFSLQLTRNWILQILALGRKFIFHDLDDNHLFISPDIVEVLQAKFDDMMDQISFPLHEKAN